MGRTLENKKEIVAELKELLDDAQLAIVIDYKGLSVAEITDLRDRLREKGAVCRVTKNTLMRIAVSDDDNWKPMTQFLKDSSAFLLAKEDLGGAIKAYQAFQKDTKKTALRGGVMEGRALSEDDLKAITELPTKEELIARIDQSGANQVGGGYQCGAEEAGSGYQRSSVFTGTSHQSRFRKRRRCGLSGLNVFVFKPCVICT